MTNRLQKPVPPTMESVRKKVLAEHAQMACRPKFLTKTEANARLDIFLRAINPNKGR